jgi:cholesterol transport system auxiliary component
VFVKIMDDRNGRIVATRTLTGDAAVTENTADGVVAGLDAALSQVLIELVRWTLSVI